jgi:ribosomal protein S18 acetylase RimI-like enzyme
MEIRYLTADDASTYSTLRLESLERDAEAFSASAEEHRTLSAEEIRRRLSSDPENKFVVGAFAGEQLVGTAGFFREKGLKERHKGRVWGVYVKLSLRGTGLGRSMLKTLLERAGKVAGIEQILLSVATTQAAAANLYRSLGFESFGVEPRALKIGNTYIDEEYMVLYADQISARVKIRKK